MGGHRRDKLEVMADILEVALGGANKTRIMYRANLNFLRANRYLSELLGIKLVVLERDSDGMALYRTTDEGRVFLRIVKRAEENLISELPV